MQEQTEEPVAMAGHDDARQEGRIARVRRLLVAPLAEYGFRHPRGVDEAEGARRLDRVCDLLAYLTDDDFPPLVEALRSKGDGSQRCFWPPLATFVGLAEVKRPRPLEELPGLMSWFASRAGVVALSENRLLAEFAFWQSMKRPPMNDADYRRIAAQAADIDHFARVTRDRLARGVGLLDPRDELRLRAMQGREEWLRGIVAQGQAARDAAQAAAKAG